jgi:hypothetical protein
MFFEFFAWWYGPGWLQAWRDSLVWADRVQRAFSVDVLLKTLFSPWKRIVSLPGRSLDEKFRAAVDNLVSRIIGFFVRVIVLMAAFVMMAVSLLAGIVLAILWPLIPFLAVGLIIWGVLG